MKLKETYAYDDVTLIPAYSELKSRSEANPSMYGYKLPIIASCMDVFGKDMAHCITTNNIPFIAHRAFKSAEEQFKAFIPDIYNPEKLNYENIWFAVGSVQKYKDWINKLIRLGVRKFCVDMAHGDSVSCIDTVKFLRARLDDKSLLTTIFGKPHIIAGNVATPEGFKRLQQAGADGIRVGIASGQICSTNLQTGFGVPILTNIIDCSKIKKDTWLIADGGCRYSGDIAKAVYFGADFVMMGKMLAATDLATGACYNSSYEKLVSDIRLDHDEPSFSLIYPDEFERVYKLAEEIDWHKHDSNCTRKNMCTRNIVTYKEYHGMASRAARSGIFNYASVEGCQGLIKYTSRTKDFIHDTYLHLQASLSYGGARNWTEFRKKVKAAKRSEAGIIAADVHMDKVTNI